MFILRRITSEGNESNTYLGKTYHYVREVENNVEYKKTLEIWLKGLKRGDDDIYGFVLHNNGQEIIPLYKRSVYFIMSSNGQTFANISMK